MRTKLLILLAFIIVVTPFGAFAGEEWGISIGSSQGAYGHNSNYYGPYLPYGIYSQYAYNNYRPYIPPPNYYHYGYGYGAGSAYSVSTPLGGTRAGTQVVPPLGPNQPSIVTIPPNSTINTLPQNPNVVVVNPHRDFIDHVGRLLNVIPWSAFYQSGNWRGGRY